jgi:hypothetical protein
MLQRASSTLSFMNLWYVAPQTPSSAGPKPSVPVAPKSARSVGSRNRWRQEIWSPQHRWLGEPQRIRIPKNVWHAARNEDQPLPVRRRPRPRTSDAVAPKNTDTVRTGPRTPRDQSSWHLEPSTPNTRRRSTLEPADPPSRDPRARGTKGPESPQNRLQSLKGPRPRKPTPHINRRSLDSRHPASPNPSPESNKDEPTKRPKPRCRPSPRDACCSTSRLNLRP